MQAFVDGTTGVRRAAAFDPQELRVHLIGIGGSGMSGAAAMLMELGAKVTGSDLTAFDGMGSLVSRGATVAIGRQDRQVSDDVNLVVASAAVPESNDELSSARARGVRVLKYSELVGLLMRTRRRGVAVAGTHGKSTTTAMCAFLCREAGLDPSFLIGARSGQLGGNTGVGAGLPFIVEACEFDRSFLHFTPESAAILNIEPDHLDCYRDLDEIVEAFSEFAARVEPDGLLVYNADDPRARRAAGAAAAGGQTFGFEAGADWRALNLREDHGCYSFVVQFRGSTVVSTRLAIAGRHNVANALAAIALAYHAGADVECIAEALPRFVGVNRRLTWRGAGRGVTIVDDYAHHPTEVRVTLDAARACYAPRRLWVVFQPHQYSRTQRLMDDFAVAFGAADEVIVPDVYGARETDGHGAGSRELVLRLCHAGAKARYIPLLADAADQVARGVEAGDLVLTMGAGDVWKVADELVERICGPHPA